MKWVNFLHIYQPANQAEDILNMVANQSYRRLFNGMLKIKQARITLNISGALSELLVAKGYKDIIDDIRTLAERGQLEFTETSKYHAFLPFLPKDEIKRQIELNREANRSIFGDIYRPSVFFPPEMAYSHKVAEVVAQMGYKAILIDEIAYNKKVEEVPYNKTYTIEGAEPLIPLFRERRASNLIASALAKDPKTFFDAVGDKFAGDEYIITGMDGETFGHHRPGLEEFIFGLCKSNIPQHIFASEVPKLFPPKDSIVPSDSTWAASELDMEEDMEYHSWDDSENEIHQKQHELLALVIDEVHKNKNASGYKKAREKLDHAVASDQFFWASNRPWWSIEMIEQGAWELMDVINTLKSNKKSIQKAKNLYEDIVFTAFKWQREGRIRKADKEAKEAVRIPFKERTLEAGKPEVYDAFIEFMEKERDKAAEKRNYEEAATWSNAIWKLETKNDIYDAMHVTDMLRNKILPGEIEKLMDKYKEKYKKLRGGQSEDRIR
ncbi:MAG: polysaccharide deacetylase family protein [Candidatus Spechtbacterales bacterium]|nr:polysaccharide deacetylase family protein [Candidatus Spechtbacterales bacterium]